MSNEDLLEAIRALLEPVEYLKFALYSRAFMKIHKNRIFSCHQRDESSIFKKMLNRLLEEKTKIDLVSLTEQVSEETGYKRSEVYQILAAAFDLIEGYCYDEE